MSVKWKIINEIHQVDTAASLAPVTQQSTDETYAFYIYSVHLRPEPTECPFPVSARQRQKQIPGGSKYMVLPVNEKGESN